MTRVRSDYQAYFEKLSIPLTSFYPCFNASDGADVVRFKWHIDVPKACATSFHACNNHEIIVRQEDWYGTRSYAKISFLYSLLCWYNPFDLCTGYVLRFVKEVLFYPKKEVMAFPNINKTRLESAMFMLTLSLTR